MPDELDKMPVNGAFFFACPIDAGRALTTQTRTIATPLAIAASAPRNPSAASRKPPTKNPAPFNAFFEPVSSATHLNRPDSSPVGTSTFTALLALIFVRSFAMPDNAWQPIT